MTYFNEFKIPVFPGVNDDATSANMASKYIAENNAIIDKLNDLEKELKQLETPIGLIAKFNWPPIPHPPGSSTNYAYSTVGGHTYSQNGSIQLTAFDDKGGNSLYLSGGVLFIHPNPDNNLDLSSKDFTIEFGWQSDEFNLGATLLKWSDQFTDLSIGLNGFNFKDSITDLDMGIVADDQVWHHYAVTRDANTFRTFKDGQLIATATGIGRVFPSTSIQVGSDSTYRARGKLDNLKILHVCKYKANFPMPAMNEAT